jgi:hypothetical protein
MAFELSPPWQGVMSAESKALAECPEISGNLFTLIALLNEIQRLGRSAQTLDFEPMCR